MIPQLKKICESFVEYSITCSNVLSLLRYVDLMNLHRLKVNYERTKSFVNYSLD